MLAYLVLAFALAPPLALIACGLGAAQVLVYLVSRRRIRALMDVDLESQARAQSYLAQLLAGVESLKVAGAERVAVDRWAELYRAELDASIARGRVDATVTSLRGMLTAGGPPLLLVVGAAMVLSGSLSLGTMLAVSALALGFLAPLDALVDAALAVASLASYAGRMDDVLATDLEQASAGVVPARLGGAVEVRGLSYRYGPESPLVVDQVDLAIPAGALVAIAEREVMDGLAELAMTRIVIAHRMSTIVNADLIVVMEAGRIVELGDHPALVARGGSYAALIAEQARSRVAAAAG